MAKAVFDQPAHQASHKLSLQAVLNDLVKDEMVSQEDADHLHFQNRLSSSRIHLHPLLVIAEQNWISKKIPNEELNLDRLCEWMAAQAQLPYVRIDPLKLDVTCVTEVMSAAYANRYKLLPLKVAEDHVVIGTDQPYFRDWEESIIHSIRKRIDRVMISPVDISRFIAEFYGVSQSIQKATSEKEGQPVSSITNLEQLVEIGKSGKLDVNDQHVVHIVDWLMQYAFDQRASDIHIEPRRDKGNIRFRIDGVLHLVNQMPMPVMAAMTSRLKTLGRMDVVERRRPQDGRIKTKTPLGNEVELRLSSMPTAFGEKIVMRIFDPDVMVNSFEDLGFSTGDIQKWKGWTKHPHGIILVTGPTGSGKTTTLYSTLKHIATGEVNVSTVEDPIEMVSADFNQMQVQPNIGLTFAAGIRTLMRQDPDIIMVGEIRDQETAEMAIQAALTGHLVLSTLHTNDAPAAITRLMDIGVPPYLIKSTILGVMAQRLVRTLCPNCKKPVTLDPAQWQKLVAPWKYAIPEKAFGPEGCIECRNTGFIRRVGIYEILTLSQGIRDLIRQDIDIDEIRKLAYKEGMEPLRLSGARKIHAGTTTLQEVLKVAPTDDDL